MRRPWFLGGKVPTPEARSISFQDVWGSGADLDSVRATTMESALTLAPVFAATRMISDGIASLPIEAYRRTGDNQTPMPTPALFTNPTVFNGVYEWVQRCLVSLLLRGNAYGLITSFDANGFPRTIEWLHPDDVTLADNRTIARPQWRWMGRAVEPWLGRDSTGELIHIPWYVLPGEILGLSPIRAFASTFEGGIYAQQFGRDWFRNGAVPSAVIESEGMATEPDATIIKARFMAAAQGRAPVVMGKGMTYKPITVPPEESQFLETIKANATTVAGIYGIYPAELIAGDTKDSMTYANVEQSSLNLITHTYRPYARKLEATFSTLLPRPQVVCFNFKDLLRTDHATRYAGHKTALDPKTGWMLIDEVRDIEDLPPLTPAQREELRPTPAPAVAPAPAPAPDQLPQPNPVRQLRPAPEGSERSA